MPEPRETHAAIDARRNARGGGEREALATIRHWHASGGVYTDDVHQALGWLLTERDALAATVERVRDLFSGGPDTPCRTTWRRVDLMLPGDSYSVECVEVVPMDDLRAALAPSDPATDTGGEAT